MNLSYWEIKAWFGNVDFTIVGSGIVGLHCALYLKQKHPKASVLVLEKGILPQGASTKNAGFACFGSLSEILDDLKTHTEEEVVALVKKRWEGFQNLRKNLGDKQLDFQQLGGYELFTKELFDECVPKIEAVNNLLQPIFSTDVFSVCENKFGFSKIHPKYVFNPFEGQIDTGKMMVNLLQKAQGLGVKIVQNCTVENFVEQNESVSVQTNLLEFTARKLFIATNGFAKQFVQEDVQPARAQVLITKPIENLQIKGTFHLDKGYYYFRNIDNRILLGGGRNLDFKTEETTEFGQTEIVQNKLEELLKNTILPKLKVQIDHRWSGIMGVGNQKKAIVKKISKNVFCGVRLGGMGVAIGSAIGKELADLES
jgi:glycine/D-amino acid oxidase-like deaminating enzyme